MISLVLDPALLATTLRVLTPLLLAALGVMISDRAGAFNIGMEGMMLVGALTGVLASAATGSAWLGLLAAVGIGATLGRLMAWIVDGLRADLIVTGIALNLAASAGTSLALLAATGDKGMSGSLKSGVLPSLRVPAFEGVPVLALVSGHNVVTWMALAAVPLMGALVARTPFGLHLRAVGADREAAAAAGIPVGRIRARALAISGAFGGLAGAYLSMGYVSWFAQDMTAGRGFVAVAIEVMGAGTAGGTLAAAALIAVAETAVIEMQGLGLPTELMQAIPYVAPILALTAWSGRRRRAAARAGLRSETEENRAT